MFQILFPKTHSQKIIIWHRFAVFHGRNQPGKIRKNTYSLFIKSRMSAFYHTDIHNLPVFIHRKTANSNGFIHFIIRPTHISHNKTTNIIWKDRHGIDKLSPARFQNLLLPPNAVTVNIRIKRNMKDYSTIYISTRFLCRLPFTHPLNHIFGRLGKQRMSGFNIFTTDNTQTINAECTHCFTCNIRL